jgi:predicted Zn-dependent protease
VKISKRRPSPSENCIDGVLGVVLSLPQRAPALGAPRRLDALFRELAKGEPSRAPEDIEDLIWSVWISHPDSEAEGTMVAAVEAMAAGALDLAKPLLDRLTETHPDWAEAWNKRATLAFLERNDEEALAYIERTLTLEPRHFGAVAGFAQICLRHDRMREARAAFLVALGINPHLDGLQDMIRELASCMPRTLH